MVFEMTWLNFCYPVMIMPRPHTPTSVSSMSTPIDCFEWCDSDAAHANRIRLMLDSTTQFLRSPAMMLFSMRCDSLDRLRPLPPSQSSVVHHIRLGSVCFPRTLPSAWCPT